jgi:replicative DNA helicase
MNSKYTKKPALALEEVPELPENIDAERAIIGAVFLDNTLIEEAAVLQPQEFSGFYHDVVWAAIVKCAESGQPIDPITVGNVLRSDDQFERIGGGTYLCDFIDGIPRLENIDNYIRIVATKARLRRGVTVGYQLVNALTDPAADESVLLAAKERLDAILDGGADADAGPQPVGDLAELYLQRLEAKCQGVIKPAVPTGLSMLDTVLGGGLIRKECTIVGGLPGMGKTALAATIADYTARAGYKVGVFELEMENDAIFDRLAAQGTGINSRRIRKGVGLSAAEFSRVAAAVRSLGECSIEFDDSRDTPLQELVRRIRKLYAKLGGLDLVIVDHLQLLSILGFKQERRHEVGLIVKVLRQLAKELDFALLLLSQLSRKQAQEVRTPRLSDLKESGDIEAHADTVLFPFRPSYIDDPSYRPPEFEADAVLIVAKQRNGPTAMIPVQFVPSLTLYRQAVAQTA